MACSDRVCRSICCDRVFVPRRRRGPRQALRRRARLHQRVSAYAAAAAALATARPTLPTRLSHGLYGRPMRRLPRDGSRGDSVPRAKDKAAPRITDTRGVGKRAGGACATTGFNSKLHLLPTSPTAARVVPRHGRERQQNRCSTRLAAVSAGYQGVVGDASRHQCPRPALRCRRARLEPLQRRFLLPFAEDGAADDPSSSPMPRRPPVFRQVLPSCEKGMDCTNPANNTLHDVAVEDGWWRDTLFSEKIYEVAAMAARAASAPKGTRACVPRLRVRVPSTLDRAASPVKPMPTRPSQPAFASSSS